MLRKLQLAPVADRLRFFAQFIFYWWPNRRFRLAHPGFTFPPAYYLYETYRLDYAAYYQDGRQTAHELIQLLSPWVDLRSPAASLMDWGCGPGRVVRHLPDLLNRQEGIFGSDYNAGYIHWNKQHIPGVKFLQNGLLPPIELGNQSLDAIYGLSIITHLSPEAHTAWINEFYRLLKPGGVLLLTTHGERFRNGLLETERQVFDKGELVTRESAVEGHRVYAAFHPLKYMHQLLSSFKVLRFIEGGSEGSVHGNQDTWIVQKPLS